ncbi:g2575 [Coccomyxa elongata]
MDTEVQQGNEPASPSQLHGRPFSPEDNLLSIHKELEKAESGLAVGWKCIAEQRTTGSRVKQWDVQYIPPDGFQPANGEYQRAYRSKVAVLRAHGVSSRPPNWTPSPAAASKKGQQTPPSDSGAEAVAVTRKKRSRRPRSQAQPSRRKTDAEMCNDEHAQQEQPSQPPSKRRMSSGSGPHTVQSDPVPGKKKRGRPAKTTSAEQPHKHRKPGWGKWQQHSDMYEAKPKPKSISTWRQLTMNQGTSEKDHKQAADSDDMWDTEGSKSDNGESEFDPQTYPVQQEQSPSVDQQHAHPQNGAQKHKTSKRVLDSSSDEELDICGVNPASSIAVHKIRNTGTQQR